MMNELPGNWQWIKLSDVAEINPKIPNKENISDDSEVQFLPMKLVEELNGKIHLTETRKYGEVKKGYTPFINGDIVFAKVTPCMENGKIAIVESLRNSIGFGSSEFHVVRSKDVLLNKYAFYYLIQQRFRSDAEHAMTGAVGLRRVPKQFIENSQLPLPSIETQQQIVSKIEELFSELDKGIEELKTAQQQLKVYRQAVLKSTFEKLNEEKTLEEVTHDYLIGIVRSNNQQNGNREGAPYIKMNNLDLDGNVELQNVVYVKVSDAEAKKYSLKKGDILINTRNSIELVGKSGVVREDVQNVVFNNNLLRIRTREEYNPLFVLYQLISPSLLQQMRKGKKSTTNVCALYQRDIFPLRVKVTSLVIQRKIVQEIESRLSVCDNIEETITDSLKQAEALRQSILKKAFQGKLSTFI